MVTIEKRTIDTLFQKAVSQFTDEVSSGFVDEESLTFGDIAGMVVKLKKALKDRGVQKGDRVAILSENGPLWGVAYFAVGTMGAVNVPILPDFHKSEVNHILRNSEAKILFVSSKLAHKLADAELKSLERIIFIDDNSSPVQKFPVENFSALIEGKEPLQKTKKEAKETEVAIGEDDLLEILYTSGTTGHSKGVMLTHNNIVSNALSVVNMIDVRPSDKFLSILPMSHSYECTCGFIAPFFMGAKVFYIKGLPTAQVLLPALEKVKPTILLSVPLIMEKIYKKKVLGEINSKTVTKLMYKIGPTKKLIHKVAGKKLYESFGGNLRFMVFGGAATPPEVEQFLIEGKFPYLTGYGLTESAPLLTANPEGKVRKQSAGQVVPEVQIRIDDPNSETGIGEIVATGPNIMQGYYRNEEATKNSFTDDGWLITGDKGYIDDEGYLFIKGRSKNLIVGPSGENIYPEEIEFHLAQNPYVLESLVYEKEGRIVARIFLDYEALDRAFSEDGIDESEASKRIQKLIEEIRTETNGKIAGYSRIHQIIEQTEEFEKTPTKKIKRYLYVS